MKHRIVKYLDATAHFLAEQVRADSLVSNEAESDTRDRFLLALSCDTTEYDDPPPGSTMAVNFNDWDPQDGMRAAYRLLDDAIRILGDQASLAGNAECTKFVRLADMIFRDHATDQHALVTKTHRRYVSVRRENADRHRAAVLARDGNACRYCGSPRNLTLDHVQPLSEGGSDHMQNLVTACRPCNLRKGARTPTEAGMVLR